MNIRKILTINVFLLLTLVFSAACSSPPTLEVVDAPTIDQIAASTEDPSIDQVIQTPTPVPTATPGPLVELVSEVTEATGLGRTIILGLSGEDWINLLISILITVLGISIITRVIFIVLQRAVNRTSSRIDDRLLESIGSQARILLAVMIIQFATNRLPFVAANLKQTLNHVYFTLFVVLTVTILWRLLDLYLEWSSEERQRETGGEQSSSLLNVVRNVLRILLLVVAASILLNHFGVNITALIALLGIGGLAFSLAAQDTLADAINGFIILIDRPYRVGDRIEINELNTWGDVIEIGTRTTRIETRDHRMVIVPNSKIGKSQIVNYSYPNPHYRLQVDYLVSDQRDLEEMRQIMINTVNGIEGVLKERPVNALVQELGDGSVRFRVRWWIDSYTDTRKIFDRVNTNMYYKFKSSGIKLASESYDLNINMQSEIMNRTARSGEG